ncbi:hypothetical protein LTR62_006686 [Meristemomyces frigidus]|uniref:Homeobox domain-containing protein n=1 Tax=Meristemomyces frigidus TaxID=1508187 RepID=A0AAN7TNT1_9PEZI|nr:hypothetical protein LTR62_006686 [Meristemomyces frigidus]
MDMSSHTAAHPAFLGHSPTTSTNDCPPDTDDRSLPRQKRKRTSPDDQEVLEAAYKYDPKPDKAARLELVKRTALGEKEVQIWFQNRRQSSRRKSRPLLPHEIVQYQLARQTSFTRDPSSSFMATDSFETDEEESLSRKDAPVVQFEGSAEEGHLPAHSPTMPYDRQPAAQITSSTFEVTSPAISSPTTLENSGLTSTAGDAAPPQHAVSPTSFLANLDQPIHKNASSAAPPRTLEHEYDTLIQPYPVRSARVGQLKKSRSMVRLSMSSDGLASITTKSGLSPSPPRPHPQGDSVIPLDSQYVARSTSRPLSDVRGALQRSSSGRSRDSRAWEFWCDKDSRTELENKAEKDASGSAADAIGLLRSASGRSILGSIPNKRNSLLHGRPSNVKRSKLGDEKRPRLLQRSSTSLGRLQHGNHPGVLNKTKHRSLKQTHSGKSMYVPGNDSDKENWSPEGDGSSATTKKMLHHELQDEYADPETDQEVKAFMRGGRQSMSSEEDMDCVQGLLSLSQGNWK